MTGRTRRIAMTLALAACLPLLGGCFGTFGLVRKVYKFNEDVSKDKWAREGVFLLLYIFPVYGGAAALDGLFFNSVEFWTGEKLISSAHQPGPTADEAVAEAPLAPGTSFEAPQAH